MRTFKAKLVFKRKRSGERKVRCVVAFMKILKKGIDFKESYAGTPRWNTVILVIILAVFYYFPLYLIDIAAFFLHGRLAPEERIYMEALPGQNFHLVTSTMWLGASMVIQLRPSGRRRSSMQP